LRPESEISEDLERRSRRAEPSDERAILVYFSVLLLTIGLGAPTGIVAIPVGYLLKDRLHLLPFQFALFGAIAATPAYLSAVLGYIRDRFRPRRMGDRGYLLGGALLAVAAYLYVGTIHAITYANLLFATLIAGLAYLVIIAAAQALTATVAQANSMTGRLSVISGLAIYIPATLSALIGGWLVAHLPPGATFIVAGCVTAIVVGQAFWRLRAVGAIEDAGPHIGTHPVAITRLLRHRPLWPATVIFFLWNFGPGWGTPMFFHLTNTVRVSSQVLGAYVAVSSLSVIPSAMAYAPLCRRFSLGSTLWWGTAVGVLQGPIMFMVQSPASAIVVAVLNGLFGGFPTAAYTDLIMRSCPKGLEGSGMMLAFITTSATASNAGNLLGSWIYSRGGFAPAVIITTLATALIIPMLWWWVPAEVTVGREGDPLAQS
jgi:predicted MFS family arabinose efflux permease